MKELHFSKDCLCQSCKLAGNRRYIGGGVYNINDKEPMPHQTNKEIKEELKEKLAAIEHQRWADWQSWVHKSIITDQRGYIIPKTTYDRWEKQIATPYAELSEAEKESDREQVARYWHLIEELFNHAYRLGQEEMRKRAIDTVDKHQRTNTYEDGEALVFKTTIKEILQALSNLEIKDKSDE